MSTSVASIEKADGSALIDFSVEKFADVVNEQLESGVQDVDAQDLQEAAEAQQEEEAPQFPFTWDRADVTAKLYNALDPLLGGAGAFQSWINRLVILRAYDGFETWTAIESVLAYPEIANLARKLKLPAIEEMISHGSSIFELARFLTEPLLSASQLDYLYLDDPQTGIAPFKILSNWPTLQDAWHMACHHTGVLSDAYVLLNSWKSRHLVEGSTFGVIPSSTTAKLKSSGLLEAGDCVALLDNQFLMFDNTGSGTQPQKRYGPEYMARFDFINLVRILVELRLGGSYSLIMSHETKGDLERAILLGVRNGLISLMQTQIEHGLIQSSRFLVISCRKTSERSILLMSYAPTVSLHRYMKGSVRSQQDFDILLFRLLVPGYTTFSESVVYASWNSRTDDLTKPPEEDTVLEWILEVSKLAKNSRAMRASDTKLREQYPELCVAMEGYMMRTGSGMILALEEEGIETKSLNMLAIVFHYMKQQYAATRKAKKIIASHHSFTKVEVDAAVNHLLRTPMVRVRQSLPVFQGLSDLAYLVKYCEVTSMRKNTFQRKLEDKHLLEWTRVSKASELTPEAAQGLQEFADTVIHIIGSSGDAALKLVKLEIAKRHRVRNAKKARAVLEELETDAAWEAECELEREAECKAEWKEESEAEWDAERERMGFIREQEELMLPRRGAARQAAEALKAHYEQEKVEVARLEKEQEERYLQREQARRDRQQAQVPTAVDEMDTASGSDSDVTWVEVDSPPRGFFKWHVNDGNEPRFAYDSVQSSYYVDEDEDTDIEDDPILSYFPLSSSAVKVNATAFSCLLHVAGQELEGPESESEGDSMQLDA